MTTSTSDAAAKGAKTTTTADDTLKEKSRDASVISGGHLVAKALKAEGVDTIFTLCGGHIIDNYDGCITRASASSTCVTSKRRRTRPMATRGRPANSAVW